MDGTRVAGRAVAVEPALCSRLRTPRSACATCAEVCPAGAIRITDEGAAIVGNCDGCGVCFAACPNGAFRILGRDDHAFLTGIRDRCRPPVSEFRIRCPRGDAPADLTLPCLGRLTEVMLLEPLRLGAAVTEILEPPCEACPSARAVSQLGKLLRGTRALCELLGRGADAIRERRVPLRRLPARTERPVTRRDFLRVMEGQATGVAAASPPSSSGLTGRAGPSFRDLLAQQRESPKRRLLLECLRGFGPTSAGAPVRVPVPSPPGAEVPSRDAIFAELRATNQCTGCGVCATLCPTGALTARWVDRQFVLDFRPWACTNCQVCVIVCRPQAIHSGETARVDRLLRAQEVRLLQVSGATCRLCLAAFPADGTEVCPLCTDRHRKQQAALHALFKEREPWIERLQENAKSTTAPSQAST